jgi:hypothetical protein
MVTVGFESKLSLWHSQNHVKYHQKIRKSHLENLLYEVRLVATLTKSIAAELEPVLIHAWVLLHMYRSLFSK